MDPSSPWLSDLGMDENPSFIHQCEHLIAAALDDDFQNSAFSSESYTSYPTFTPPTSTAANAFTRADRPAKLPKAADRGWNASRKAPPVSAPRHVASSPRILSFGRPQEAATEDPHRLLWSFPGAEPVKPEQGTEFFVSSMEAQGPKRAAKVAARPPSRAQDHVIAERKRREKISERLIALSAVVPGLKKTDKASILADAVKYVQHLEERVRTLEAQAARRTVESVVLVKRSQLPPASDDDISSSCENSDVASLRPGERLPEVEAKVSDRSVLVRLHCEKRKGVLGKVLAELERLHLAVVNASVVPFAGCALDITVVAQMETELSMTVKDLVEHLNSACRELV